MKELTFKIKQYKSRKKKIHSYTDFITYQENDTFNLFYRINNKGRHIKLNKIFKTYNECEIFIDDCLMKNSILWYGKHCFKNSKYTYSI